MKERVLCPVCNRRIFDIDLCGQACIEIKCPHCRRVVTVQRAAANETGRTQGRAARAFRS